MNAAQGDPWPLTPCDPLAGPAGDAEAAIERAGLLGALRVFAAGAAGGVLALVGVGLLAMPQRTCGATRSLRLVREDREVCLRLGITPEELAARRAAGELPGRGEP